jgi:predicted PurR-regulated permease PerM
MRLNDDKRPADKLEVTVSNRTMARIILIVLITIGLVMAVVRIKTALMLLFLAFFLALALNAPVIRIAKLLPGRIKGSRLAATSISYLIVIAVLAVFFAYVIPPFVHNTEKFISAAPHLVKETQDQSSALGKFVREHHLQSEVNNLSKQISSKLTDIGGKLFVDIYGIVKDVFSLLAVLALAFMMLVEGPRWLTFFKQLFLPFRDEKTISRVGKEMYAVIKGYVNGQVLLALIAAILVGPVLFIMHVSYPVALMVVVFICGLIPLIGHTIGAIILTVVALFHSITAAIIVLVWYIIYINFENYLLQPRIQANTTNMSPLLVFASIIVGINFAGLVGGLIAIPVAGVLRVLIIEILEYKNVLPKNYLEENSKHS